MEFEEWNGKLKYDNITGSFAFDKSIRLPADSLVLSTLSNKDNIIKYLKLNKTAENNRKKSDNEFIWMFQNRSNVMKDVIDKNKNYL